jgi:hypothetical protein
MTLSNPDRMPSPPVGTRLWLLPERVLDYPQSNAERCWTKERLPVRTFHRHILELWYRPLRGKWSYPTHVSRVNDDVQEGISRCSLRRPFFSLPFLPVPCSRHDEPSQNTREILDFRRVKPKSGLRRRERVGSRTSRVGWCGVACSSHHRWALAPLTRWKLYLGRKYCGG